MSYFFLGTFLEVVLVVLIFVSSWSYEIQKDLSDSPAGERRRADRPGAKCTKLAAEGR